LAHVDADVVAGFAKTYFTKQRARVLFVTPGGGSSYVGKAAGRIDALPGGAGEGPPSAAPTSPQNLAHAPRLEDARRFTLPSGLELVVVRREGAPVVRVGLGLCGGRAAATRRGAPEIAAALALPDTHTHGTLSAVSASGGSYITDDQQVLWFQAAPENL